METEFRHHLADINDDSANNEEAKEKKELAENIHERLESIIRTVSGNNKLTVVTKVPPKLLIQGAMTGKDMRKEWFYMPKISGKTDKEYVYIPKVIESSENFAKGAAAHEGAHAAITRMGHFVPDEVMQQFGFHSILAAAEERPTDQVVRDRFPGAGEWLDETRRDLWKEGQDIAVKDKAKLGYLPKFQQLANMIVFEPHGDTGSDYDESVVRTYEEIREFVEEYEHALPPEGSTQEEVMEVAKERYKIFYADIWSRVQELLEQDKKAEELRQMLNEMMHEQQRREQQKQKNKKKQEEQTESSSEEEAKGPVQQAIDQLSDNLKEELQEKLDEAKKKKEEFEESQKKGEAETDQAESEEEQLGQDEAGGPELGGEPVPIDDFSQELMEAVKEVFDKLPPQVKREIQKKAQEILEQLEDELAKQFAGKFDRDPTETHKEFHDREERETREEQEQERKEKEDRAATELLKELERKEAIESPASDVYENAYKEVHDMDEKLYRRLEEIFSPNVKRTMKLRSSGSRINLPAVYKWEASRGAGVKNLDNRIFESVHLPEKKDYAFTLLVDLSGSMSDYNKIQETFKAVVLLAEVLNRLGIPNEILGFQDEVIGFKKFDQKMIDSIRKKMSGMIAEVKSINPDGHNRSQWNDDGPCLADASKSLESQQAKEKFLLVFSDGQPDGRRSGDYDLHDAVEKIITQTNQKLVGLGLGRDTEHVQTYYPTALPNINVRELPEVLSALLEDMIVSPEKYTQKSADRPKRPTRRSDFWDDAF
jgi:hypothetical protein